MFCCTTPGMHHPSLTAWASVEFFQDDVWVYKKHPIEQQQSLRQVPTIGWWKIKAGQPSMHSESTTVDRWIPTVHLHFPWQLSITPTATVISVHFCGFPYTEAGKSEMSFVHRMLFDILVNQAEISPFSRDLGHPWYEFDHFTFDPSAHFSGFGAWSAGRLRWRRVMRTSDGENWRFDASKASTRPAQRSA